MSKISLKHSGGNVVSLNSPTNAPSTADVAFKLPNADGSDGQAIVTDGSGNLSFGSVAATRNLIINGAMQVAQRGTSSTSSGYQTVDRFNHGGGGWDAALTQSQVDVASGTTPYTSGFRKAFKITNGNQSSGLGSGDSFYIETSIEAQNLATSGWNYTSSSSYITISFWIKSSVAQNFYGYLKTQDGTSQRYPYETGTLSADTWTKITKTIPGNSNITIDNNNGAGLYWEMIWLSGTDYTDSGVTLNQWGAFASGTRTPDSTATWFTTNAATLEITGVQLEVGSTATDFEHRSYGDELLKCQRYYEHSYNTGIGVGANSNVGGYYENLTSDNGNNAPFSIEYKVQKRAVPSLAFYADDGTANQWSYGRNGANGQTSVTGHRNSQTHCNGYIGVGAAWVACYAAGHWTSSSEL